MLFNNNEIFIFFKMTFIMTYTEGLKICETNFKRFSSFIRLRFSGEIEL